MNERDILAAVDFEKQGEEQYETLVVKSLLSRYHLGAGVKHRIMAASGCMKLTLAGFHDTLPTFPVILAARKFRKIKERTRVVDLFSDFPKRDFVKAWHEERDRALGLDGTFALVFYWPYLKGQLLPNPEGKPKRQFGGGVGLVLHNGDSRLEVPGVRLVVVSPVGDEKLTLQPLSVLLSEIDADYGEKGWSP